MLMSGIDTSGPYQDSDLEDIQDKCHWGNMRNGGKLLAWARAFARKTDIALQGELLERVQKATLTENANLSQLDMFLRNLWRDWQLLDGSRIDKPAAFYHKLLSALPKAASGIYFQMRTELAKMMARDAAELLDVPAILEKLSAEAKLLGLSPGTVNAINGKDTKRTNGCNRCKAIGCTSKPCLVFDIKANLDGLTTGVKNFVLDCRAYVAKKPGTTSLKRLDYPTIKEAIGKSASQTTKPTGAPVVLEASPPSAGTAALSSAGSCKSMSCFHS